VRTNLTDKSLGVRIPRLEEKVGDEAEVVNKDGILPGLEVPFRKRERTPR
jgi:hypothetical protein